MRRLAGLTIGLAVALALAATAAPALDRKDVPQKYTWAIEDVYPTKAAWEEARRGLEQRTREMDSFVGHLGDSAQTLLQAVQAMEALEKSLGRVGLYAQMTYDVDTRNPEGQAMRQSIEKLSSDLGASMSFFDPELLALPPATLERFLKEEPRLAVYKPYLDDILRNRAHVLGPPEEKILARSATVAASPGSIYTIFTNADLPFPEVTLSTGEKVRLSQAAYSKYRASAVRADRDAVFKAFWPAYAAYERTLGTTLYSHVKGHVVSKEVRAYPSCLAAALDADAIPEAVYSQLIADVHKNLPTLQRYLKLRQRLLGVEQLRYEDLYAPLVREVDLAYTPEEAMALTLKALAPLGPAYTDVLKKGFESRWIDFTPTPGKKSGAYSTGSAYDVHPFELLNFNGGYDDVSTLAHEMGHGMHSYYSNKNQTYLNAHYSIFVAEVASTLNENLLFYASYAGAKDDETRLYLLGERLDGYRQTLFRQTLFAEFEWRIHEMAERGETLTGDSLTKLYLQLVREYYGHDAGVCQIDELYGHEWSFIPHFYRNFYVYQYATSLTASTAIAQKIRLEAAYKRPEGHDPYKTRDAYIQMLSAGSSKHPVDLLKDVGVDMTTSAPFDAAMKEMNALMGEIEAILKKR